MDPRAAGRVVHRTVASVSRITPLGTGHRAAAASDTGHEPAEVKRLLLVEPAGSTLRRLRSSIRSDVQVTVSRTFEDARRRLLAQPPDLLVTNLRLQVHNGLHLVYLTAGANFGTRSIVFADPHDPVLAHEAQGAGAFYERPETLAHALDAYLRATLPRQDRRDFGRVSRRRFLRGGRRAVDCLPDGRP
jgi:ActR/RegA family two-component response regulator